MWDIRGVHFDLDKLRNRKEEDRVNRDDNSPVDFTEIIISRMELEQIETIENLHKGFDISRRNILRASQTRAFFQNL